MWTTTGRARLAGERQLQREGAALQLSGRVIVVVVEAALADRHRARVEKGAKTRWVGDGIERGRIVRVHAGGGEDEAGVTRRDRRGTLGGRQRFPNADERAGSSPTRSFYDFLAIRVERRVGEMDMTVDEVRHGRSCRPVARAERPAAAIASRDAASYDPSDVPDDRRAVRPSSPP